MKKHEKYVTLPNFLTFLRIVCAIGLIFTESVGDLFFILYLVCGITDAVDGTIARLTGTASDFGAKFDSIADIMFYSIMILKFFPTLLETVSGHIWLAIILIVLIRVVTYLYFAIRYHTMVANHTYLNKITGFTVFCLPFVINTKFFDLYSIMVCLIATVAAVYELTICFGGKNVKKP